MATDEFAGNGAEMQDAFARLGWRVLGLPGRDREVDALIHMEIAPEYGARYPAVIGNRPEYVRFSDVWRRNRADHVNHANNVADWWKVPEYTASVDAAMRAIPLPDFRLCSIRQLAHDGVWEVVLVSGDAGLKAACGEHESLPHAVLIASLAARAALRKSGGADNG